VITEDSIKVLLQEMKQAREKARVKKMVYSIISDLDLIDDEDLVELYNAFVSRLCAVRDK
jgi:hypothetical protein